MPRSPKFSCLLISLLLTGTVTGAGEKEEIPGSKEGNKNSLEHLELKLAPDVTMKLVKVPAGTFLMGSDPAQRFRVRDGRENPRREVTIGRDFYIGTCEVTRADDPQVNHLGGVSRRAGLAYAAAALLAIGRVTDGVLLANEVMKAFDGEGRLYSTVDSVAAIGMMTELSRVGLLGGRARVRVNGRTMSIAEAEALSDQVETVEVLEGAAVVEISRIVEDAWPDGATGAVLDIRLEGAGGGSSPRLSGGSKVELVARLPGGYEIGDLVHICLPPCLSWLKGGGRVQRFSVDFEGAAEVRVPLVVTGALRGLQHYAVCVRNMFDESRAIGRSRIPLRSA